MTSHENQFFFFAQPFKKPNYTWFQAFKFCESTHNNLGASQTTKSGSSENLGNVKKAVKMPRNTSSTSRAILRKTRFPFGTSLYQGNTESHKTSKLGTLVSLRINAFSLNWFTYAFLCCHRRFRSVNRDFKQRGQGRRQGHRNLWEDGGKDAAGGQSLLSLLIFFLSFSGRFHWKQFAITFW